MLLLALLCAFFFLGCSAAKTEPEADTDPVVARYRDTEIRQSLVDYEKKNQSALSGGKEVRERDEVDQLLLNRIMLDEAERLGLSVTQAAGHQIALHSASHEYSDIYRSSEAYWADIALLKERIAPYVDAESIRYLRFPGGSTNTVSRRYGGKGLMQQLKAEAEQKGFQWVDWNVCAEDAVGGHPSADTIYRNVVRETGEQTHCVVLMHDSSTTRTTAEALPDIIRWYADNGYTFLTVAEALPVG